METGGFDVGLARMRQGVESFGEHQLKHLGGMIGAAFSAHAVIHFAERQMEAAHRTETLSENLGVETDTLQALQAATIKYGGTVDQVERSLQKLKVAQGNAVLRPEGKAAQAFKDLGITDVGSKSRTELIDELGKAYVAAGESASAFADIQAILGKGGTELAGVLRDIGENGLAALTKGAIEAGDALDAHTVAALARADVALQQLEKRGGNFLTTWMAKIGMAISDFGTALGAIVGVGFEEASRQLASGELKTMESQLADEEEKRKQKQEERDKEEARRNAEKADAQDKATEKKKQDRIDDRVAAATLARDKAISGISVGAVPAADTLAAKGAYIGGQASYQSAIAERALKVAEIQSEWLAKIHEATDKGREAAEKTVAVLEE